jgi:hypothetical protein
MKFFEGHGWFLGEIVSINEDCCHVRYEEGDEENYLLDELDDLDKIIVNVNVVSSSDELVSDNLE